MLLRRVAIGGAGAIVGGGVGMSFMDDGRQHGQLIGVLFGFPIGAGVGAVVALIIFA